MTEIANDNASGPLTPRRAGESWAAYAIDPLRGVVAEKFGTVQGWCDKEKAKARRQAADYRYWRRHYLWHSIKTAPMRAWRSFLANYMLYTEVNSFPTWRYSPEWIKAVNTPGSGPHFASDYPPSVRVGTKTVYRLWRGRPHSTYARKLWQIERKSS